MQFRIGSVILECFNIATFSNYLPYYPDRRLPPSHCGILIYTGHTADLVALYVTWLH